MPNIPARSLASSRQEHLDDHNTLAAFHNLIDAKGDLIVGTAADTAGKLSATTEDYVLSIASDLSLVWRSNTAAKTTYAGSAALAATNVEAALDELDAEKAPVAHAHAWEILAAAPSSPTEGQHYIDSTTDTLRVYYEAAWRDVKVLV